ncbi:hypothetical protein, partial [Paenibacillus sp. FJAT-26967]|uniref:hypothetical protein n=1 Tax=Paenibacillus sp. FJAT-26967 TaxID=1729690 RepID=UPI001C12B29A
NAKTPPKLSSISYDMKHFLEGVLFCLTLRGQSQVPSVFYAFCGDTFFQQLLESSSKHIRVHVAQRGRSIEAFRQSERQKMPGS